SGVRGTNFMAFSFQSEVNPTRIGYFFPIMWRSPRGCNTLLSSPRPVRGPRNDMLGGNVQSCDDRQHMKVEPPSGFNQHIFFEAKSVFYGTDDGYQDGSCTEFQLYEDFCQSVTPQRREKIHL